MALIKKTVGGYNDPSASHRKYGVLFIFLQEGFIMEEFVEENQTNQIEVCVRCGAPLADGQSFCPKCGAPRGGKERRICNNCGAELQEDQNFCPKCGARFSLENLNSSPAPVAEKAPKKKVWKVLIPILAAVLAVVAGLVVFIVIADNNKQKKKKEAAQEIYALLDKASQEAEEYGSDIYTAWNTGINDADESGFDLSSLAKPLNVSTNELKQGFVYLLNEEDWDTISDSDKRKKLDEANTSFKLALILVDSKFSLCVNTVNATYRVTGREEAIKKDLEEARVLLKDLSDKNPDYEVCAKLKAFYTKIQTYFDFCMNPTGSFSSLKDTITTFRQDVLAAKNELNFDLN